MLSKYDCMDWLSKYRANLDHRKCCRGLVLLKFKPEYFETGK